MLSVLARGALIRAAATTDIDAARIAQSRSPVFGSPRTRVVIVSAEVADAHALALCADLKRRVVYAEADGEEVDVLQTSDFARPGTLVGLRVMLVATGDTPIYEQALFVTRALYAGSSLAPTGLEARVAVWTPEGRCSIDVTDEHSLVFERRENRWCLATPEFIHASHEVVPCARDTAGSWFDVAVGADCSVSSTATSDTPISLPSAAVT